MNRPVQEVHDPPRFLSVFRTLEARIGVSKREIRLVSVAATQACRVIHAHVMRTFYPSTMPVVLRVSK